MIEKLLLLAVILSVFAVGYGVTDPGDAAIINAFRDGLENPQVLKWPAKGNDPCGPPSWNGVFCQDGRVQQIQAKDLNLKGTLPENLNQLTMLENIGLQRNQFTGQVPSLSGLKNLKFAYLDYNEFDSIPGDFLKGLDSLQVVALDNNNFNASTGWMLSEDILGSPQLVNVSCMRCNLAGDLPDFLGKLVSLTVLRLSGNRITGPIPASFDGLSLQILWLNDQSGGGMTGPIDMVATMPSLVSLWLHGNQFSGTIPEKIVNLTSLKDFDVNGNKLVGFVPFGMANMSLDHLDLNNNMLMGPTPKFKVPKARYEMNDFCLPTPGVPCAPEVMALLDFLSWLNYPPRLVSSWSGNDPCHSWLGVSCYDDKVSVINLPNFGLTGELCPSIGRLYGLTQIRLANNHLRGLIPESWTSLKSLQLLDLGNNSISSPVPKFGSSVKLELGGNPTNNTTHGSSSSSGNNSSPDVDSIFGNSSSMPLSQSSSTASSIIKGVVIPTASAIVVAALLLAILLILYTRKNRAKSELQPSHLTNQRYPSDPDKMVKISVANNVINAPSILTESGSASGSSNGGVDYHYGEEGNLIISIRVLRNLTNNFAPEKELGHGGFGVVYMGELDDGTKIAVKRMEAGIVNSKALDEFHSEIAVLSKVRHRNLVSLLGYCIEGNERILVYEYVSQGALSKHLFHWKNLNLEPVSWNRRLYIALDVARGLEYLHNLTHQSFIHRDLKSSNILLGEDFRAKISDFGLVKLAPEGERSLATRLAGTFGYLAPEYAGKITTKVDVYSFGVVLMELLTGLVVIDESRSEEKRYLASWFWNIKTNKEKLRAAVDPALEVNDETFESISVIAELAGHCTAREPRQRPDMSYCVNVLSPLVEKWIPLADDTDECCGIDYSLPLNQLVQGWQESEGKNLHCSGLDNSKNSLPGRPAGFAESFTSVDAR